MTKAYLNFKALSGRTFFIWIAAVGTLLATSAGLKPPQQIWSFQGMFGTYDRAALQRGFQVYQEVCSSCHSMNFIKYRQLKDIGFTENQIKAIAAHKQIVAGHDGEGKKIERPATPADPFVPPYETPQEARDANNGALPPDMSSLVNARKNGPDYIFALITGYGHTQPKDMQLSPNQYYNPYMEGGAIAMPPPLKDGQVEYADGTKSTVSQMAKDVVTFLAWTSEPNLEARKRLGWKVLLYLSFMTILFYFAKRRIWADVKKPKIQKKLK